ncbi:MAG: 3-deoxy-8-phosphooctulonate synthase [Phycisphaerales bacterium]|nr:3-deoxy-8-phosphooctulonate synthase [Phycisphaerales bacterium]
MRRCTVGPLTFGDGQALGVIAGPCALESVDLACEVGTLLRDVCAEHGLQYVFKASYDKANRTSVTSKRGPGLGQGLDWLATVRDRLGVPVTTDVHAPDQCDAVAQVADILQIPAFLCRQTDLVVAASEAAASHGRAVNIKKGQFLAPDEIVGPIGKARDAGCTNLMVTERGTFFGYHRLVNDFIGLGELLEMDTPVVFDATHSTQLPGSGTQTGGKPRFAPLLARAAVASGVDVVFIECHPEPSQALSDSATMQRLDAMPGLLADLAALAGLRGG